MDDEAKFKLMIFELRKAATKDCYRLVRLKKVRQNVKKGRVELDGVEN
jgi:hypothetical protein